MGKHNSTRVDEGRKSWNLLAIKNVMHEPWSGGGEQSLLCDPGSQWRLGEREKKKGEDNKWDGKKKQTGIHQVRLITWYTIRYLVYTTWYTGAVRTGTRMYYMVQPEHLHVYLSLHRYSTTGTRAGVLFFLPCIKYEVLILVSLGLEFLFFRFCSQN